LGLVVRFWARHVNIMAISKLIKQQIVRDYLREIQLSGKVLDGISNWCWLDGTESWSDKSGVQDSIEVQFKTQTLNWKNGSFPIG